MYTITALSVLLVAASAAPGVLLAPAAVVHAAPVLPVVAARTTITKSSQVVNHGTPLVHAVHSAPVVHALHAAPVVHTVHAAPVVHAVHAAPVVHAVHAAPVVHAVHAAPLVLKTAPVAVSHSSSLVHHTPVVKTLPLLVHH